MYESDSFFALTTTGRVGLITLSVAMAAGTVLALVVCARHYNAAMRFLLALIVYWLFVWLSPQLYYLYYLWLIGSLPLHSVIGIPPGLVELGRLLGFAGQASLAQHALGVFGWLLILVSLFVRLPERRS